MGSKMGNHYNFVCLSAAFHDFIGGLYVKRNVCGKFSGHRARRFAVCDVRNVRNSAGNDSYRKPIFEFFSRQKLPYGGLFFNWSYDCGVRLCR